MGRFLGRWEGRPSNVEILVMDSTQGLLDAALASEGEVLLMTDGQMWGTGFDCNGDVLIERLRKLIGERLVRAIIITGAPTEFAFAVDRIGAEVIEKTPDPSHLREIIAEFAAT
jgi:hypothetical protein